MTKRLALHQGHSKTVLLRSVYSAITAGALLLSSGVSAADLSDVYSRAKDYDPTIRAAIANHQAATAQLPLAKSAFRPQVNLGADASLNDVNDDSSDTFPSTRLTLSLSQSIFHKSNAALLDQAKLGVLQADANLEAARQQLIVRVAEAYFNVLRAEAAVAFSDAERTAIARQKDQAEKRFEVGLTSPIRSCHRSRSSRHQSIIHRKRSTFIAYWHNR